MLVNGLSARLSGQPPEAMARVEIFVNTRRMQRRIQTLFEESAACLLPNIRLVTDLVNDPAGKNVKPAVSDLRRRLELSQLVAQLLDKEPDLAPRSTMFDLADSLALLLTEMHDEDVSPADISRLDVTDHSGHWQRSQKFLNIVTRYFNTSDDEAPDIAARQRMAIEFLINKWATEPPTNPVIVAGSTGSRGSTSLLMQAVARLPQGAIILPGFDFDQPDEIWHQLNNVLAAEDHPQFRFAQLMRALDLSAYEVHPWQSQLIDSVVARNRLISLALRPAPFTNQWMQEGPLLQNTKSATQEMTLIEAASDRLEAVAIALALRDAAEDGKTAALVTPDRLLTRRVAAALDTWKIEPDVSAGKPLSLSAPGRLLRHIAELFNRTLKSDTLLILLKHPLTNTGSDDRGQHLLWTRELEMKFRREGPPFPTKSDLMDWAASGKDNADRIVWAEWLTRTLFGHDKTGNRPLGNHLSTHLEIAESLANGPNPTQQSQLWQHESGLESQKVITELEQNSQYGGVMGAADYVAFFQSALNRSEVREPVRPHPNIMIWGTLEARVQGADLVILGSLNDGIWPELPAPDPWLNRKMRANVGLLVPERRIGLSAHDFQQSIAAKSVILTRSLRNADSETVPSRWLNRLTNLMGGMSAEGERCLAEMRDRGLKWIDLAQQLDAPNKKEPPENRPSPQPPVKARPRSLSVTAISRLIRDPYAIYAANILRLRKLDPMHQLPEAPLRGTILHLVLEKFVHETDLSQGFEFAKSELLKITNEVLENHAPWPAARELWRAKLERVADIFLRDEFTRQSYAKPVALEVWGALWFADLDFTLKGKADRIDQTSSGQFIIYDYKTGTPPTAQQLLNFDKQLLLEAVMIENGAFENLPVGKVESVAHIGLGSTPKFDPVALDPGDSAKIRAEFLELIAQYQKQTQGYTSRRAMAEMRFGNDYDQLARFGEWDETQAPVPVEVGK